MKILIVEDGVNLSRVLRIALSGAGHSVCTASNGLDGLGKVARWLPDLIVTDINMPTMDGISFCRSVRRFSQVPILAMSSSTGSAAIAEVLDAGADDYMPKPFSVPELLARIRGFERRSALGR